MKKIVLSMILAVVMMIGAVPTFAAETANYEKGCTYRVTVKDNSQAGGITVMDENYDVKSYVVIAGDDYGYIFIPTDESLIISDCNLNYELVATEDIGVSGIHVYIYTEYRTFDPVIENEPMAIEGIYSAEDFE